MRENCEKMQRVISGGRWDTMALWQVATWQQEGTTSSSDLPRTRSLRHWWPQLLLLLGSHRTNLQIHAGKKRPGKKWRAKVRIGASKERLCSRLKQSEPAGIKPTVIWPLDYNDRNHEAWVSRKLKSWLSGSLSLLEERENQLIGLNRGESSHSMGRFSRAQWIAAGKLHYAMEELVNEGCRTNVLMR